MGFDGWKLNNLKAELKARELNIDVEVDGGVTPANAKRIMEAGANVLVAGSAVFKGDIEANVKAFKEIM